MTLSRREVLIAAAAVAAASATTFPDAIAETVYAQSPLTPPPRVMIRCGENLRLYMMSSFFYVRTPDLPSSPEQAATALLNMHRDLATGETISEVDLDALGKERREQLAGFSWDFNWDVSDPDHYAAHALAVCRWLDNEVSQIIIANGRVTPSEGEVRTLAARALVEQAQKLNELEFTDEALAVCDEVIQRFGISERYGASALVKKYIWLEEVGRGPECNEVWRQIWTCMDMPPLFLWSRAERRHYKQVFGRRPGCDQTGKPADRSVLVSCYLAPQPSRAFDDLRVKIGVPLVDKGLGDTPTQRYRKFTSRTVGISGQESRVRSSE